MKVKGSRWTKAWVVLKEETLFCYQRSKEFGPDDVRNLHQCTIRSRSSSKKEQTDPLKFEIVTIEAKKTISFKAQNEEERESWIKAIQVTFLID